MTSRLTHRHIEVFRALMVTGSVTRAAALLHSSQPTLSRELARLEQVLGMPLFERDNAGLRPTLAALTLFEEVKRAYTGLEQVAALADTLRTHQGGQLSIIALPTFTHSLLPGACARFQRQFPEVAMALAAQESPYLEECLSAQRFDLGLTEHASAPAGTHLTPLLCTDEVCILPAGHRLLEQSRIALTDLADEDFVSLSPTDPYRMALDADCARLGIVRHLVAEAPSAVAVCSLVRKGVGLAIVNPLTALDFEGRQLHIRPLAVSYPFHVSVVRPAHRPVHALTAHFIAALHQEAASMLQALAR